MGRTVEGRTRHVYVPRVWRVRVAGMGAKGKENADRLGQYRVAMVAQDMADAPIVVAEDGEIKGKA